MSLSIGGNIKNPFTLRKAPTIHPEVLESVMGVAQVLFALGRYGAPIKSYNTLAGGGEDGPNVVKQSSIASLDLRSIDTRDASVMENSSLGMWLWWCVSVFVIRVCYLCLLTSYYMNPSLSLPLTPTLPQPFPPPPLRHGIPCPL